MSKPWIHALSSAKRFGGKPEDYMPLHELMDSSKSAIPDNRHRMLTHNSWFIGFVIPRVFGEVFTNSDGKVISSRDIAEQHCSEDYKGFIPSACDFSMSMTFEPWMDNGNGKPPSYAKITRENVRSKRKINLMEMEDVGKD